jgi:hypothetical protein
MPGGAPGAYGGNANGQGGGNGGAGGPGGGNAGQGSGAVLQGPNGTASAGPAGSPTSAPNGGAYPGQYAAPQGANTGSSEGENPPAGAVPVQAGAPGSVIASTTEPPPEGQAPRSKATPPNWEASSAPAASGVSARPWFGPAGQGGGEANPLARLAAPQLIATDKPTPRKAAPLSRLTGNRDFVIRVDCDSAQATVSPGGAQFRWPAGASKDADQRLARYVQQLIERRQASVRPGEPPYRPVIRFHVAPDGLRTYFRAYPPLEPLRVPMSRENLEE